jgi:hypothetical protein
MHDLIAELRGLRAELDNCENGPRRATRAATADQVREQIARLRLVLSEDADRLDAEAGDLADEGQDGLAGDAAVAARTIRTALDADEAADSDPEDPAARTALAEARGRALAAADQLRQRDERRRLAEHLGTGDEPRAAAKGRRRNAAAAKAPEQT